MVQYYFPLRKLWENQINLILVTCCGLFLIMIYYVQISKPSFIYQTYNNVVTAENPLHCHFLNTLDSLPDIQDIHVQEDESIFFVETSCNSYVNGKILINARQACAVESAALMNPNRMIYLLYASPGNFLDKMTESDRLLKNLMAYTNVKILHFAMDRFIRGTPVENLWSSGKIQKSNFIIEHTSDILRQLVLWKYGGIYLDLDVVVIKSLESIPLNFVGAEDMRILGSSVISFTKKGIGHQHINASLHNISQHFDGKQWAANGPLAITKLLVSLCNTQDIPKMINNTCQGVKVFPSSAFAPILWSSWELFFDETKVEYVEEKTKDSYLLHMWNKLSHNTKIPLYKDVPYLNFAKRYCPETVFSLEEHFRRK